MSESKKRTSTINHIVLVLQRDSNRGEWSAWSLGKGSTKNVNLAMRHRKEGAQDSWNKDLGLLTSVSKTYDEQRSCSM